MDVVTLVQRLRLITQHSSSPNQPPRPHGCRPYPLHCSLQVFHPTNVLLAPALRPQHPHLAKLTRTPAEVRRLLEVGPRASTPLGYGGMPNGVVVLGTVKGSFQAWPLHFGPLPRLGCHVCRPLPCCLLLLCPLVHLGVPQLLLDPGTPAVSGGNFAPPVKSAL